MSETAEPYVGKTLNERTYAVTDSALADYYNGLDLIARNDALVPTMLASDAENGYFNEIAYPNHVGHLWMRQEIESFGSLALGETYAIEGSIRDIYQHRDRSVVQYQAEVKNASGTILMRTQHHQSFLREKPAGGEVRFRNPAKKPGARKFGPPAGEPIDELTRTITLEMCGEYFHGDANYHTDRQKSEQLGFRDVVVGGRMTLAYATHILEQFYQEAWWKSGRLVAKFTNPTWPNDTVTVRIAENGRVGDRLRTFVWMTKADDTVVLVAEASADHSTTMLR